jgi:hypothetical protein
MLLLALWAGFTVPAASEDAKLVNEPLKFGNVGSDVPLCQALIEAARERVKRNINQCTPPIPIDDPRFGQVSWKALDPNDHRDVLKQIFVWNLVNGNWIPDSQNISRALDKGPPLNEQLVQDLWDKYKRNYPSLIESGKIRLEEATVDLASDSSSIAVYRTTLITASNQHGNSDWRTEDCSEASGQASYPQWRLFYQFRAGRWEEFTNLNHWVFGRSDLLVWAGRAYQVDLRDPVGFVVPRHTSRSGSIYAGRDLCVVKPVWE